MKLNRIQLRRLIIESLNEGKKSYPPLKLKDMKNVGDNNKDITMEVIRSSLKNTRILDNTMANKYPDTKATGRFVVEDYDPDGTSARKRVSEKYGFYYRKIAMFAPTIDGKKYHVMIEKVLIDLDDRED